jgi:eukaryotic-like serine/threonine-protein kinase
VQLAPKDEDWWGNLGDAYRWTPGEKGKAAAAYNMAIGLAQDHLKINPKSAGTLVTLAICEAKVGNRQDATAAIRRAVNLDPEDPQNIYIEALVTHLTGDHAGALDFLRKAVAKGYPISEILAEPEWNDLSRDPEFKKIVEGPGKKES